MLNRYSLAGLLVLLYFSCNSVNQKTNSIKPGWHKLTLPNGWIVYAPKSFTSSNLRGVDSAPGSIVSKTDSVNLQFDSGQSDHNENCSADKKIKYATDEIDTGFYRTYYHIPYQHTAAIDTIDNKIAVIVKPTKIGKGTVGIEIYGCKNQPWLGITGENLTAKQEALVLDIFKTIRNSK